MKKRIFETPELTVIRFAEDDIITTSSGFDGYENDADEFDKVTGNE